LIDIGCRIKPGMTVARIKPGASTRFSRPGMTVARIKLGMTGVKA
jgi:hypothetical protein